MDDKLAIESAFIKACRGVRPASTPIWLMRQAGRYLPEYRALREKYSFLELCREPELICEVTSQPLRRFNLDAAIIFSDITIILNALGVKFSLEENVGPVMESPVKSPDDIYRLSRIPCAEAVPYLYEGIKLTKKAISVPLIGFAAAPFTLASYLMAGKKGRDQAAARKFMYSEPKAWDHLMNLVVDTTIDYLSEQVKAGVQAIQIFDSWIGDLSPETYETICFKPMQRLFNSLKQFNLPIIHFGTGTAQLLSVMSQAGGDVIGVDWRTPITFAMSQVKDKPLQGNLDPALLFAPWEFIQPEANKVLKDMSAAPAHIFNLGHGILPNTPVDNVQKLVEYVHSWS